MASFLRTNNFNVAVKTDNTFGEIIKKKLKYEKINLVFINCVVVHVLKSGNVLTRYLFGRVSSLTLMFNFYYAEYLILEYFKISHIQVQGKNQLYP